jgi:3,4-dihydroxy 2-butanone 4-phosphate synthase/GTP cyclohydrolase II
MEQAIAELAAGRPIVVLDECRGEGDIVVAAELATPELLAFVVRHTSGFVCVALTEDDADRLDLPLLHRQHQRDSHGAAFAVTVDAREGVSTGISAADRARTIRLLADERTTPTALSRPGHVVPLRASTGGVLRRAGHAEAAVDLARLAGLRPAGLLCALTSEERPAEMARGPELRQFADRHGLAMISIDQVIGHRSRVDSSVERVAAARVPLTAGEFTAVAYVGPLDDREHIAFICGDVGDGDDVLVHVHRECLTGDVFGSRRCDCSGDLEAALDAVAAAGRGVVVYLRGQEGRGGLLQKLQAHQAQDAGHGSSTDVDGASAHARDYGIGAHILADLGIRSARLLAADSLACAVLEGSGVSIVDPTGRRAAAMTEDGEVLVPHRQPATRPISAAAG